MVYGPIIPAQQLLSIDAAVNAVLVFFDFFNFNDFTGKSRLFF